MAKSSIVGFDVEGVAPLSRALRVLQEKELPFLTAALEESGKDLRGAAASRAKGGIGQAVEFAGVKGNGVGVRATIAIKHPGAKSMEFGRKYWYRGFSVAKRKSTREATFRTKDGKASARIKAGMVRASKGTLFEAKPGQPARPFLGIIKGGGAIGAVEERVKARLSAAIDAEWNRISEGS